MRITEAARRLGTSPRMLRYRETLGLIPPAREPSWPQRRARVPAVIRPGHSAGPGGQPLPRPAPPAGPAGPGDQPLPRPARPARPASPGRQAVSPPAPPAGPRGPAHRQFDEDDLAIAALALDVERRLDVSPAELSFGIKVLADPAVRAQVAGLARRLGRIPPLPGRALDFEQERALRLLRAAAPLPPAR